MKKLLLISSVLFIGLAASAQCYSKLAGTYIVNGDSARPAFLSCESYVAGDTGILLGNNEYFMTVNCGGHSVSVNHFDCSFTIIGEGSFTADYNYISIIYNVYNVSEQGSQGTWTDNYTRIPLLPEPKQPAIKQDSASVVEVKPFTNPVTQFLNFTISDNDLPPTVNVRIFNLTGKCVFQDAAVLVTGEHVSINVQNLQPAMYILTVSMPKYVLQTIKFIKQ